MIEESKIYKGYYRIPRPNCDYFISKAGKIINEKTGLFLKSQITPKGYVTIRFRIGFPKQSEVHRVHRLIAFLFVPRPERHSGIPYSELQVNHKDGNKKNNHYLNLEWMTNEENMKHARENNLFSNEKVVLGKNVVTGEIIEFKSISECSRWLCMNVSRLYIHLNSVCAGIIQRDGYVFKLKDDKPWPERISYDKDTTTLNHVADVIAENVVDGKKFLCKTLIHAIGIAGLTRNKVMNHRSRFGNDVPVDGWIFYQFKPTR